MKFRVGITGLKNPIGDPLRILYAWKKDFTLTLWKWQGDRYRQGDRYMSVKFVENIGQLIYRVTAIYRAVIYRFDCILDKLYVQLSKAKWQICSSKG